MQQVDLILSPRWVLPIHPTTDLLENHSVIIHHGKIIDLIATNEAIKKYQANETRELHDHLVMPGLVNAHAHTPMNLFRGLADDLDLMDWLNNHIWPAEKSLINVESVALGSRLAIAEMLRGGVTTFNDNYFFPDTTAKVAIDEGIRACLGNVIMSVPTGWASEEKTYFKKALSILENQPHHDRITWTITPHAPYTVSNESLKHVKKISDELNLPIHMHMHETSFECEQSIKEYQARPLERVHKLGLLSDKFIAIHMVHLTDDEIKLVKNTGTHVVHCPESNLKLASGFAPTGKLLAAGVNVAIGTDGAASNNDLDMFGELKTAALIAKAVNADPKCIPAFTALKMATYNGAKAIGLENKIGSIEKGKQADLIAINLNHYFTQPIYHPISHLAYAVNRLQVSDVWVDGEPLLRNGEFTKLNTKRLLEETQRWRYNGFNEAEGVNR